MCHKKATRKPRLTGRAGIYIPFSGAAMFNSYTTVASAFIMLKVLFNMNTLIFKRASTQPKKVSDVFGYPHLIFSTSTCEGASFGSVPPKAGLKKCAANFFKESKAATKQVRPDSYRDGGKSNKLKRVIKLIKDFLYFFLWKKK